jgi:multiple sugar transport system substrate-binding protein
MRGLRLITLAAIPVLVLSACSGSTATTAPAATSAAPAAITDVPGTPLPTGVVQVRWFVGLGGGTQPSQIDAQKAFVANYNKTNKDNISIKLEIVPNANAYDVLKTEIAAGNAPDIIGPVGVKGRNGFEGLFLDLTAEVAKNNYDLTASDPALVKFFQQGGDGQVGLPYDIYPGYIWYNKDIFNKAGLAPLPAKVGDKYNGSDWTWETLGKVAAQLTVDKTGKKSTDAGFDAKNIVQYGMDFQWSDGRRTASLFGGGSFVAADGKTAQIPAAWTTAFTWYYDAIWKGHYVPNGAAESSTLLAQGNSQSSGHVAMNAAWGWSISSIASKADTAKVKAWDMAVVPASNGVTTSPMDADTFTITKASKHQDQAFKAMVAIMADQTLLKNYGGEPAQTAAQAAYFKDFDATLAPIFPGNTVTWSVLGEMAKVPAVPSHEANMPAFTQASNDYGAFYTKLQNNAGLDVAAELTKLQATLQKDFDNAQPLLNQ